MAEQQKAGDRAAEKAEDKAASRANPQKDDSASSDATVGADASTRAVPPTRAVVLGGDESFDTKVTGAVDPRTGEKFKGAAREGLKGTHGEEVLRGDALVVQGVDPDHIPAEVLPGFTPDSGGNKLLAAAQAKAPSLTQEFVDAMEIDEVTLAQIARGEIPPPPTPGPIHTNDLYRTPGGYQVTPPGVPPEQVGRNAVAR